MNILLKALTAPSVKRNFLLLLIILGTFYIYFTALTGPFMWDDEHFVLRNPSITSVENILEYFTSKATFSEAGNFDIYRPIRNLSYLIDYLIFGLNPFGFHFINVVLHVQNIVLLACLVRVMTGSNFMAMVSSALFAVHPVQTEAVSWIKGRDDLIATFFYLTSLTLYIKGRYKGGYLYWSSVVSFALALLSKEMAVTLPLVIFLYNLHFPKEGGSRSSYHPYIYLLLLYLLIRTVVVGGVAQTNYWGEGFLASFYTNWTGMVYYLKLLFFPVNLCADYLMFPVRTSIFDFYVIGAISVILFLLGVAVFSFRKGNRLLSFSISWFFIALLPVSNLVPIEATIAERFLYLPSIGIFIGGAVLLSYFSKGALSGHKPLVSLIAVISIFLASMTVDRNHVWTDEHLFWQDVIDQSPGNTRAWHNLASGYQNKGKITEAVFFYKKALTMEYHSPETHFQLGRIYRGLGEDETAMTEFFEALKDDPENVDMNYEIGNLMSKKEWSSEAISRYKKTLESNPNHEDALYDLGIMYMKQKDYALAAVQFKKLLIIAPGNKMAAGFLEYCKNMGD